MQRGATHLLAATYACNESICYITTSAAEGAAVCKWFIRDRVYLHICEFNCVVVSFFDNGFHYRIYEQAVAFGMAAKTYLFEIKCP